MKQQRPNVQHTDSTPEFPLQSVSRAHTLYHSAVLPPKQCAQSQMLISVAETGFSARSVLLKIKAYAHFLFFAVTPGVTHLGPTFHDQDISSFSSAFFPVSRLSGSLCLFTTILTILQIDKFNFHPFFMISQAGLFHRHVFILYELSFNILFLFSQTRYFCVFVIYCDL